MLSTTKRFCWAAVLSFQSSFRRTRDGQQPRHRPRFRRPRRDRRHGAAPLREAVWTCDEHRGLGRKATTKSRLRSVDDLARVAPGVTFLRNGMSSSGNYNDEDSISRSAASTRPGRIDHRHLRGRHADPDPAPQLRHGEPVPGAVRPRPRRGAEGPAGTLFGRIEAGRFGHHARSELDDLLGYARAELANRRRRPELRGGRAFGGPIIDGVLGFRVSASFREDGGWVDRVTTRRARIVDGGTSGSRR